ncbi:hypothetical protein O3P69_014961 [Scylla paramamosain]|uniref:Uncharacterized protein n=1 Tax=Scylla paramamosain TaxID=85552 RepID=A0AAW0SCE0_SCYPA
MALRESMAPPAQLASPGNLRGHDDTQAIPEACRVILNVDVATEVVPQQAPLQVQRVLCASGDRCVLRQLWPASFTWCVDMSCTWGVAAVNMFHSREVLAV